MSARRTAPGRVLAVLALVAAVAALVAIVSGSLGDWSSGERPARIGKGSGNRGTDQSKPSRIPRFYRVQAGDSLLLISQRTGVPLTRIERLNPGIDDLTLQIGARLKLR
jgi:LysM domain